MPKVSIIIACYNQGAYIEEAVNSVVSQTFTDWEIIIINDGSTEELTNELLSAFTAPNTTIIRTDNKGLSSARNTGISKACGTYILPLDADDAIAPTYIEKALAAFESDENYKLVYCKGRYFGLKEHSIEESAKPFNYKDLLVYNSIFCSALFRKDEFIKAGGYSQNMQGGWEDWDLWLRLLKDAKLYQIPEELFFYRIKNNSMIQEVKKNELLQIELEEKIFENNLAAYFKFFGPPISVYRELLYLREKSEIFEKTKEQIYGTWSYKIGNFLLKPFKILRKVGN